MFPLQPVNEGCINEFFPFFSEKALARFYGLKISLCSLHAHSAISRQGHKCSRCQDTPAAHAVHRHLRGHGRARATPAARATQAVHARAATTARRARRPGTRCRRSARRRPMPGTLLVGGRPSRCALHASARQQETIARRRHLANHASQAACCRARVSACCASSPAA